MSTPQIAIVGAGVAGLTLARVLQVHGVGSTLFELDTATQSRDQGGTLDLHLESGQVALHAMGLFSKFQTLVRDDAQETRVIDKHAKIHLHDNSPKSIVEKPEIDRGDLRQLMIDAIDSNTIKWGTRVEEIKPSQTQAGLTATKYTVVYNSDQEATFDLVVGADGAWSKVRKLLSDTLPCHSGITLVEFRISEFRARHPKLLDLVGAGSCFMYSGGQGLVAQVNADRTLRIYAALSAREDQLSEIRSAISNPDNARRYLLGHFADWDEGIKDLIRVSDDHFIPRPIYALPVPYVWESKPGLTLVGDAAHLMSPFAGMGANMAMWDAATLGEKLAHAIKTGKPLTDAVAEYEQEMYQKTRPATTMSASNMKKFMSPNNLELAVQILTH
ncbi:hypothetical protein DFQ26_002278 [Actinomortierella ambigua]|nr:hypothetical protein DFQ26_002278 [Actinomortierella ambigua]